MLYNLECKLSEKDYFEFNKYHMSDSDDMKKLNLIVKLCLPAVFLIELIYFIIRGDDIYSLVIALISYVVAFVAFIAILKPVSLWLTKLHIRFMKKNGKLPYSDLSIMEFYDDYFVEKTANTKTELQYDAIYKVRVNEPKAVYIYQNAVLGYVIPFEAFASDDERNKFIDFICEKIKK